jgi:hypothetical protein
LVSSACFGTNVIWYIPPDQKVDAKTTTRASFGKNVTKREFSSVLIYRLQRKGGLRSNVDDASTSLQLLVIWRSDHKHGCSVRVLLIKHDSTITWNEDKLKELDCPHLALPRNDCIIKNTWLLDNATMLVTSKWKKRIRTIKITISKGTRRNGCMEPIQVSSDM